MIAAAERATAVPVLDLQSVERTYPRAAGPVAALRGVTFQVGAGEWVSITGPSGSGKTTLLGILGCLDVPTGGRYLLAGLSVGALPDVELSRVRNRTIGFVFQSFHLLPHLSVVENVETPLLYGELPEARWRERAHACLAAVGLDHRADHRPAELSGGEAQRAAIARALVTEPAVLLADEPTGNLDSANGRQIADLLARLHGSGRTVVLVTHEDSLARRAQRLLRLRDGRVEDEERLG